MDTLQDVHRIVNEYYLKTGQQMEKVSDGEDFTKAAKHAELRFTEGLAQLERLKLTAADRRNFKLLRESFCDVIKSMREIQRGNTKKADKYAAMSGEKASRYAMAVGGRNG